jgi:glycerophosphoryl diester phosphodiesterase
MRITKLLMVLFFSIGISGQETILNIGHRGAMGHEPENTLASIKKAIDLGADGFEIDVFKCLSGEIVLFHDKHLDKLTDGEGLIEKKSLIDLKKLSVLGTENKIPTLEEVLNIINKQVFLNIELKGKNTAKASLELVEKFINQKKISSQNILFSSFDWNELEKVRELNSDVKIALITENDPLLAIETAKKLKAFAINPNYKDLSKKNIKIIHNNDFKIYTWTVNNKRDISKMKLLKVDGIITDFPDRF